MPEILRENGGKIFLKELIEKLKGKGASKSAAYRYKDDAPNRRLIKFRKEKKNEFVLN